MKTFRVIGMALLVILVSVNFTACSDDDDDSSTDQTGMLVNPAKVFPHGIPKSVGDMQTFCDPQGRVSKIVDDGTVVTFSYDIAQTRASVTEPERYDVIMHIDEDSYTLYIKLNKSGFMTFYEQIGNDESEREAPDRFGQCDYNADGQLTKLRRAWEQDDYTLTYKNGDMVNVRNNCGGTIYNTAIGYGDQPIENKGGIMLYDETLDIDMDEIKYVYYAGMLGKPTKNLPVKLTEKDEYDPYIENFEWTLNPQGLPIQLRSYYGDGYEQDPNRVIDFRW